MCTLHSINNNLLLACLQNKETKKQAWYAHFIQGVEEYKTWAQCDGVDWKPCDKQTRETLRIEQHILSTESLCAAAQEYSRPTLTDWFHPLSYWRDSLSFNNKPIHNALSSFFPFTTTYRCSKANKQKKWRIEWEDNDSVQYKQNVSAACRLRQFPAMAFSSEAADELTVKANTGWRAVNMHLLCIHFCSSSLLTFPRDWKWILVEVHQKHRKYCQKEEQKGGWGVITVSATEKCFSTRPLIIIKVQQEAAARVVQPQPDMWQQPCDWLKRASDE